MDGLNAVSSKPDIAEMSTKGETSPVPVQDQHFPLMSTSFQGPLVR